jgi:hypothetical protein
MSTHVLHFDAKSRALTVAVLGLSSCGLRHMQRLMGVISRFRRSQQGEEFAASVPRARHGAPARPPVATSPRPPPRDGLFNKTRRQ